MKFYNQYLNRRNSVAEKNNGESIVDLSLYRPISKRIDDYIRSGETLEDTRRLIYHSDYLGRLYEDDKWTDPLMYRGYERVDIELYHKQMIDEITERRQTKAVKELSTVEGDKTPEEVFEKICNGRGAELEE